MSIVVLVLLISSLAMVGGVAHPRTRRLLIAKEPLKLLPGESQSLREWKAIFRDTVISVEGQLSPEMSAFLAGEEERVSKVLADAKTQGEKVIADAKVQAEKARAELFKEQDEWTTNDRPLLIGAARAEYQSDYDSAKTPTERGRVIYRWHNKGFRYPREMRAVLMQSAVDEDTRNGWRKIFDEQDKSA